MPNEIEDFNAEFERLPLASGIPGVSVPLPDVTSPLESEPESSDAEETESDETEDDVSDVPESGLRNRYERLRRRIEYASYRARQAGDWIAERPTPGGTGTLLAAIFIMLFAIVPVSKQGKTRLALIWDTINARTFLEGRRSPIGGGANDQHQFGGYDDRPFAEVAYTGGVTPSDIDLSEL